MKTSLLVGVDPGFSPATHYMLRTVSPLFADLSLSVEVAVLTVIPFPNDPWVAALYPGSTTKSQRMEALQAQAQARALLLQAGVACERIQTLIREGSPVHQLVRVARERHVTCIVIGSRGDSFRERTRRFLLGSVSRCILRLSPCPVLLASLPATTSPVQLATWYEQAIVDMLHARSTGFLIFTPEEVASRFPSPFPRGGRERRVQAAKEALLHLAEQGVLICQHIEGTWRCFND